MCIRDRREADRHTDKQRVKGGERANENEEQNVIFAPLKSNANNNVDVIPET